MKVFISSVISGFESYRDAAAAAARTLGHAVIRAEDFSASPESPRRACLEGVRQADVVVLIVGPRYGQTQDSGLSPTHEEYREARERIPVLVLVEESADRDAKHADFLKELQAWSGGHFTAPFSTSEELRDAVTRALHDLELAQASGLVEAEEILERARALIPDDRDRAQPRLALAVAGGPGRAVVRPSELEAAGLADKLKKEALFGKFPVFTAESGTQSRVEGHRLILEQDRGLLVVDEQGSILVTVSIERPEQEFWSVIIEEDLREQILHAIHFADTVLDELDPLHRLTHVVPVAALLGASYLGWMTRAEHAQRGNTLRIPLNAGGPTVHLAPPHRTRAAMRLKAGEIADDLLVLLRRSRG